MTIEQYKLRAAEFRSHMEEPMPLTNPNCVLATKVSAYLPGGEKRSMKVQPPSYESEDLSHLNSPFWKKLKAAGKRNGRRPKR